MNMKMFHKNSLAAYMTLIFLKFRIIQCLSVMDCISLIKYNIIQEIQPRRITFYLNNNRSIDSSENNMFIQKIIQEVPSSIIGSKNRLTPYSSTSSNREYLSLYLILDYCVKSAFKNVELLLDSLFELHPRSLCPKTVLICLDSNFSTKSEMFKLFKYAWIIKFLEFSIVAQYGKDSLSRNACVLQYYNPFYEITHEEILKDNVQLFPDKLINGNEYSLTLASSTAESKTEFIKNNVGDVIGIKGFKVSLAISILRFMNFSLRFVEVGQNRSYRQGMVELSNMLEKNDINLIIVTPKKIYTSDDLNISQVDMENDCQRLVVVIPALPMIKVYMSLEILVYLYLVPLLLAIFFYFLKALIIHQSALQTIHVIQVIFNGSIIKHLHMISDRIFLLIFFMLNMFYSIENYLNFLSLQLDNDYTSFGTFILRA